MLSRMILAVFVTSYLGLAGAADHQTDGHGAHFAACSKACTDCMRECESCAHHCSHMITGGHKEHIKTLRTCEDCAEFCAAAARITARHGAMANTMCDACAKACDICGKACEEFPSDEHMARCAKACRDCARACREMLQHVRTADTR